MSPKKISLYRGALIFGTGVREAGCSTSRFPGFRICFCDYSSLKIHTKDVAVTYISISKGILHTNINLFSVKCRFYRECLSITIYIAYIIVYNIYPHLNVF